MRATLWPRAAPAGPASRRVSSESSGGPGRLPARGSHRSGHADFPHPALQSRALLTPWTGAHPLAKDFPWHPSCQLCYAPELRVREVGPWHVLAFPSDGSLLRLPLPSTGSRWEQFPGFFGTMGSSDFSTPFPLHFVFLRSAVPLLHRPVFSRAPPGRPRRALGGFGKPGLHTSGQASEEASRPPRFLGDPLAFVPCSRTPEGPLVLAFSTLAVLPSAIPTASAPSTVPISGLNRTARPLAVYAPQPGSPRVHARLASGCWPALPGGIRTHRVPLRGFRAGLSALPSSSSRLHLAHRHPGSGVAVDVASPSCPAPATDVVLALSLVLSLNLPSEPVLCRSRSQACAVVLLMRPDWRERCSRLQGNHEETSSRSSNEAWPRRPGPGARGSRFASSFFVDRDGGTWTRR